jgi:hypothetical protein
MYIALIKVNNKMSRVLISKLLNTHTLMTELCKVPSCYISGHFVHLVISYLCKISPTILLHVAYVFLILDTKSYLSDNECHICKHKILWMSFILYGLSPYSLATVFMNSQISNVIKWNDWHSFSFVKNNPIPELLKC